MFEGEDRKAGGVMTSALELLYSIDMKRTPSIYRTNNPKYHGKWCIDYFPENVPTIAPFDTPLAALTFLTEQHGQEQVDKWFAPFFIAAAKEWRP